MARMKHEHVFGAMGLVIGVGTLTLGAVALWWDYRRDKHNGIVADPLPGPPRGITALPPAQAVPVKPLTKAQIAEIQRFLNGIAGKKLLTDDGKVGPATTTAVKSFQARHNMAQTGHLDGMTQSAIATEYAYVSHGQMSPDGPPRFAFRIAWDPARSVWTAQDSMRFVTDIPGREDHNHPPTDQEVAAVLSKHYGASSTTGKAIAAHLYEWSCSDCAGIS